MTKAIRRLPWFCFTLVALTLVVAACQPAEINLPETPSLAGSPTPTPLAATPLPPAPQTLIVCLGREPESLYLYSPLRLHGAANREADVVLQAIYDGPFDSLGYRLQPVILEKTPSLADGDARLETITVREGDIYLNPESLLPQALAEGDRYLPAGCRDLSCSLLYSGGEVSMNRMVVDFRLLADLRWSDGEPLTAADSAFSFGLHAHRDTRDINKFAVQHTASYQAVDNRMVRWTGIPGFLDPEYASNFWTPLPEHVLAGIAPADLPEAEPAARQPLGWGPYVLESWEPGVQISLRKNPLYLRASEGLPRFDVLIFRFTGGDPVSAVQQLLTGECDVLDETALEGADLATLISLEEAGRLRLGWTAGPLLERIDFNLDPISPADASELFFDERTRHALAGCINRQGMVDDVLGGLGQVTDSYLPRDHPLYAASLEPTAYDPNAAATALEDIGWLDEDGDPATARTALGVPGVRGGTRLEFALLTLSEPFQTAVAERVQQDLAQCGAVVQVQTLDPTQLPTPFPAGPVFGRAFQAVLWSWLVSDVPACEMFASQEIPSDGNPNGSNASGFVDAEYDVACRTLRLGVPHDEAFRRAAQQTQEILAARLPTVPLFVRPRLVAYGPGVCGLSPDASAYSVLWNLEALGPEGTCEGG
ncbi:MAG: ABC transporter substrate-binding protein [Chloroflexota bacterium]